jgi:hypothetical protein
MASFTHNYTGSEIKQYVSKLEKQGLSGDALAKRIYDDAKTAGVSTGQLENSMGWDKGTVKKWTNLTKNEALNGGYGNPVVSYNDATNSFNKDDISTRVASLQAGTNSTLEHGMRIYHDAVANGMTARQLEDAMGWEEGIVDKWTTANQLDSLSNPTSITVPKKPESSVINTNKLNAELPSAVMRNINPNTDTVQGQLDGLLAKENPLMQRAYYKGLDRANSRGLLNSSMSSEAAQAAMMDVALPIAKQDASTYYDQGKTNQAYTNQFNLNDRVYGQNAEQASLNRQHDISMSNLGYRQNVGLSNLDYQQNVGMSNLSYLQASEQAALGRQHDYGLSDQAYSQSAIQADLDRLHEIASRNQASQNAVNEGAYDVTANTQGAYLASIDKIINNTAVSINEIETSQNITQAEKDTMITNTVARRDADLSWTRKLYSNMPTWDLSWINLETMPAAPGLT